MKRTATGHVIATPEQIAYLRQRIAASTAPKVARELSMNHATMLRAMAGLPVFRGTVAQIDAAMGSAAPPNEAA